MSKYLVGLDDGHGINTPGKRTVELKENIKFNGKIRKKGTIIHENEFNEVIMKKVETILKRCGIGYIELAPTDADTPLSTRANTANRKGCDLVVSIHANALAGTKWQTKAYGLVVIKTRGCQSRTDKFASIMYKHLKEVDFPSNGETKYGVRVDTEISGFTLAILRQTKMPAVLVELGFMDNWNDVKAMCTEKFQDECAEGIAKAVCEYLGVTYKKDNSSTSNEVVSTKKFQVKVLSNTLNVRKVADWDAKPITTVKKDQHLDVIGTVDAKNGKTKMYKLESGLYITASEKYVKKV
ncbi:N-acetylmuramoyl-L-alanine amidase [Peptostreptococcus porci]|uniref:N-acetylmuramoyl-L-alanine amidase n=1 Tax=Peptostreptococcus porci TaxID=2652282 RepID=UPI002A8255F0|nr:N-acetylmuramoyl-L-alanine amidase [Peptostreptococcus porci]MDY4127664.1 N-acetylmuramoyl-L-alanine amidase [Peptostreptococcus porci]